jgi:hypothetical protein
MKQTAVEWLVEQYKKVGGISISMAEIAKEMEKEQIVDAFGVGCQVESTRLIGYQDMAEQYYNQTFKSE